MNRRDAERFAERIDFMILVSAISAVHIVLGLFLLAV